MSLTVVDAGLLTTVQAGPRTGWRHRGVPYSGAADSLSLALANRLVGNRLDAAGVELTLSGASFAANRELTIAVTGAPCEVSVDGRGMAMHERCTVSRGARIVIGPALSGARSYLAVGGGIAVPEVLNSASTYLPAGFGGLDGRQLRAGDSLAAADSSDLPDAARTPDEYRPVFGNSFTLRAVPGPEHGLLDDAGVIFGSPWAVDPRNDRMGVLLTGARLSVESTGELSSRPVFPGTVQCTEAGRLFVLGVDAQTTGGYPRVAEIIRSDRFLIGQLRMGARLHLLERDAESARREYRQSLAFWRGWLEQPDVAI